MSYEGMHFKLKKKSFFREKENCRRDKGGQHRRQPSCRQTQGPVNQEDQVRQAQCPANQSSKARQTQGLVNQKDQVNVAANLDLLKSMPTMRIR